MKGQWLICAAALAVSAPVAHGATPSFQGLGTPPHGYTAGSWCYGVSPDGQVAVGMFKLVYDPYTEEAFMWTRAGGMVALGDIPGGGFGSRAYGVSGAGGVVVGNGLYGNPSEGEYHAFRWTLLEGCVDLGDLAGGSGQSVANDLSADGSVVVGFADAPMREAFRWTAQDGMVSLGDLPGGITHSTAYGISPDGSAIVGVGASGQSGEEAFRWTEQGGMSGLGFLNKGTNKHSVAWNTSVQGETVVGYAVYRINSNDYREAFVWTESTGMVGLGFLTASPGYVPTSEARAVSDDGSVIVGYGLTMTGDRDPFIWDAAHGMRPLKDVLVNDCGLNLTGWNLEMATGVSANGMTIVGTGYNPDGQLEGWIARVPEPATLSLLAMGMTAIWMRKRWVTR